MQNQTLNYYAIGVMSGTSLDGLDLAYCRFELHNGKWSFELLDAICVNYTLETKEMLKSAFSSSSQEITRIDTEFGIFIGNQVLSFIQRQKQKPDLIASHGQTIFHRPELGYTLQIGSGAHIASITGITTVCNFRQLDVAMGGQGAPLVPIGDSLLFSEFNACLNLGGFANISYKADDKIIAYDICPVNFVLNKLVGQLNLDMDRDGEIASGGEINKALLEELNQLAYYKKTGFKSLGQEWVEKEILPVLSNYAGCLVPDLLRTFTEHIAFQINKVFNSNFDGKVLVTGGGALNSFLMERIRGLASNEIVVPAKEIIDFKEAIIFALLGVLRVRGEINTLASVTGAKSNSCGGVIFVK